MQRFALSLLLLIPGTTVLAEEEPELAAIRARIASYQEAFNRGDAEAVAAHWSEGAVYLSRDSGERVEGREAIRGAFEEWFAGNDRPRLSVTLDSIRLITDDAAIEDGRARIVTATAPPSDSTYTAVHVKRDGRWYVDSVREMTLPGPPSNSDRLQGLAWMVGEWVDADAADSEAGAAVHTTCAWTKNHNFITRSFRVAIGDEINLEGTQVIGWDAAAGVIHSWMFDSDGGTAQATWTQDGDRWIVQSEQLLRDGSRASATNVLSPIDADRFSWQSTRRRVGDERLDDIGPVTVVRKSASAEPLPALFRMQRIEPT